MFSIIGIISYLISDVPSDVKAKLAREKHLAKEALYQAELEKVRKEKMNQKDHQLDGGINSDGITSNSVNRAEHSSTTSKGS